MSDFRSRQRTAKPDIYAGKNMTDPTQIERAALEYIHLSAAIPGGDDPYAVLAVIANCSRVALDKLDATELQPAASVAPIWERAASDPGAALISAISILERNGSLHADVGKQMRDCVDGMNAAQRELLRELEARDGEGLAPRSLGRARGPNLPVPPSHPRGD